MESCERPAWRRKLGALVDGELAEEEARAIRDHLASCSRCTATVALDLRIRGAIRSLPAAKAPASLSAAVLARTAPDFAPRYRRQARLFPALRLAIPSALVVAFLLALKMTGILRVTTAVASILWVAVARSAFGMIEGLRDALSPVAKVAEFGRAGRALVETAHDLFAASQSELALMAAVIMLILILVGVRFVARRAPRGIGHAALV